MAEWISILMCKKKKKYRKSELRLMTLVQMLCLFNDYKSVFELVEKFWLLWEFFK